MQLCLLIFLEVYSSVFIHYDNLLTCVYAPIHADTAAGIIVDGCSRAIAGTAVRASSRSPRKSPSMGLQGSVRWGEERIPCVWLVCSYSVASAAPLDLQSAARPPSPPAPPDAALHEPQSSRNLPHLAPESHPFPLHGPTPPSPPPCPLTGAPTDLNKYRANSNKQYIYPQRNSRLLPRPAWLRLARADGRMSRPSRRP
jgi:hypothetical protein